MVVDEREEVAEERAGGRGKLEPSVLDQAHDGERRQSLRPACDPEAGADGVRDRPAAVCEAIGLLELETVRGVDPNDAGEQRLGGDRVELALEGGHRRTLLPSGCLHHSLAR